MARQPSGTVTFLFTDIEGSTRLVAKLGEDGYAQALDDHRQLLRAAFERHAGYEVDYEGDAFIVAFQSASEALAAAGEAQSALSEHAWPEGCPFLVRMGLHTGEPLVAPPKYVGLDVHKAARIMAAGHGGQVLVSRATREHLDEPVPLTDLGEHRLKDFDEAVPIFQLGDGAFPPLKTISNTNLPRPVSSFLGRERELGEVLARIENGARLLTLTGPGGTGKTRLALEAALTLVPDYKAGVFWVGLSSLRQPALVTETMAQTLGARDSLAAHIGELELLLVLDNFEQVIEAAPDLSALLQACPNLALLVTSRELLRVQGEVEYPVPPLQEPEAVSLFCARSGLEPSSEIAELCARLDSLPLAVELAAARANVLAPAQILERISQRLDLLQGGRDADPRQRTLRAAIEWSHDLLSDDERQLFARLSVFSGGCTLEAAEEICDAPWDCFGSLVDKNLVRRRDERYWMLETIRDFAHECLVEREGSETIARTHLDWHLAFVETMAGELFGAEQGYWLGLLEREHDNLRGALTWAYEVGEIELALRLTAGLQSFWYKHGHIAEGRRWFERAIAASPQSQELRARTLQGAGVFAGAQDDWRRAQEFAEEGLSLYRELGDRRGTAILLRDLGATAVRRGDYDLAVQSYEESAALFRKLDERTLLATVIANIGDVAFRRGDFAQAAERTSESLAIQRELGALFGVTVSLITLGFIALREGRDEDARVALEESMLLARELGSTDNLAYTFEGMAAVAAVRMDWDRAALLLGRAEAIREATATELEAAEQIVHERTLTALRAAKSEEEVAELSDAGRLLSDDAAIDLARALGHVAHA